MRGMVRRSPTLGLSTFNEVDKLFDNLFNSFMLPSTSLSLPSVDIYSEDDRNMVVEMQAPGFEADDIEINVRDNVLEISGEKREKEEHEDKKRSYMVRESSSSFVRRIALPEGADSEKIAAELDKGVLRVTVPVEQAAPKRIKVEAPKAKGRAKLTSLTGNKTEEK